MQLWQPLACIIGSFVALWLLFYVNERMYAWSLDHKDRPRHLATYRLWTVIFVLLIILVVVVVLLGVGVLVFQR